MKDPRAGPTSTRRSGRVRSEVQTLLGSSIAGAWDSSGPGYGLRRRADAVEQGQRRHPRSRLGVEAAQTGHRAIRGLVVGGPGDRQRRTSCASSSPVSLREMSPTRPARLPKGHAWRWAGAAIRAGNGVLRERFRTDPSNGDASYALTTPTEADLRDLARIQATVPAGP